MMKSLMILAFCALTLAGRSSQAGVLLITEHEGNVKSDISKLDSSSYVLLKGYQVLASDQMSVFDYDGKESLEKYASGMFLTVDKKGKLITTDKSRGGFNMKPVEGRTNQRHLSYKGDKVFVLCGDGLINLKSTCAGAKNIELVFEDLF